jgi:hypothetical protein
MSKLNVLGIIIFGLYSLMVIPTAAQDISSGETIPDMIRRPQRGEAPRYPQDTIIGALGRGEAAEGAYILARNFLNVVISKNKDADLLNGLGNTFISDLFKTLEPVNPQKFRIGGGRDEPDGSTSFLVRFVGRDQWISGELYLRFEEDQWKIEDLILEEVMSASEGGEQYRFDFSPYERFF